jgi:glycosyltransferase involved in cell wall biosynthesis
MRILCFNWRDIKNPYSGGAEVILHEIFKRAVRSGHEVTLFTASFDRAAPSETVDGIPVIREGDRYSVYSKARQFYETNGKDYDIVIDSINTKPFDTPKFVKDKPILVVFYQLAREYWFYETRFPLSFIGRYFLEDYWLKSYRNVPTVTISRSSERDLKELGFTNVSIVPVGSNVKPLDDIPAKEATPTIIFVGRLRRIKFPDHIIETMGYIRKEIPDAQLWIVGDGPIRQDLERRAGDGIKFFGAIWQLEKKMELLSKAHVSVVTSIREGWGLVVTEANAMGTTTVGYDVPGIRDSIINNQTGLLVEFGDRKGLADAIIRILKDERLRIDLSRRALEYARNFDYDKSASIFLDIVNRTAKFYSDRT